MNNILLTEEHKSKLLEMCKELFQEYTFGFENDYSDVGIMEWYSRNMEENQEWQFTHWFELCMTHLVNRLYYPDNKGQRDTRSKVEYFFFQSFIDSVEGATSGYEHPIDYLYEQFLKLKSKDNK